MLNLVDEPAALTAESAAEAAAARLYAWRCATTAERALIARKAASILRHRLDAFASSLMTEVPQSFAEARADVRLSADILDACGQATVPVSAPPNRYASPDRLTLENGLSLFCVRPNNCSHHQLARFVAPNLVLGRLVLVKHSGRIVAHAMAFERLWLEAGAPVGAYVNLVMASD